MEDSVDRRPIPEASAAVVAICDKASTAIDTLMSGAAIGIKLLPQILPNWELQVRLVPSE
jgi:hypothetical protein